jgi:hypothetical protein
LQAAFLCLRHLARASILFGGDFCIALLGNVYRIRGDLDQAEAPALFVP